MKNEGNGKGEVYIKVVLKSGDYKLRKSETKALEVLEKVFAERDLSGRLAIRLCIVAGTELACRKRDGGK